MAVLRLRPVRSIRIEAAKRRLGEVAPTGAEVTVPEKVLRGTVEQLVQWCLG